MTSRAQQVRSSSNRICEKIAPTHPMWEGCGCRCDDQHFDAATRSSVGTRPPCSLPWRTSTAHQACSSRYGGEIIKIIQIITMSTVPCWSRSEDSQIFFDPTLHPLHWPGIFGISPDKHCKVVYKWRFLVHFYFPFTCNILIFLCQYFFIGQALGKHWARCFLLFKDLMNNMFKICAISDFLSKPFYEENLEVFPFLHYQHRSAKPL